MTTDGYARIADLYDQVPLYRSRPDVEFFVGAAREAGSPVLEIGSGTGRVLIPTARAGIDITGLDSSASMLEQCRLHLGAEPPEVRQRVTLVQGDMRDFQLDRRFRLATLPFRPFQHLVTVEEQLACLASIRSHLDPSGTLILDLFNPSLEALVSRPIGQDMPEGDEITLADGRRLSRRHRILSHDRAAQVNEVELIYDIVHPDGRTEEFVHAFPMRYLFRFEAEHLLERAGFRVTAVYGGYDRSPFGTSYPGELILFATR